MNDKRCITLGDLILYSTYAQKDKIFFSLETLKRLFDDEGLLKTNPVDFANILEMMVTVFNEFPGDKVQLNLKTQEYEAIVLKLFPENIRMKDDTRDWIIQEYGRGIIPSENLKDKVKRKGGILTIRIPDEYGWLFDILDKNSAARYGKKNRSLYAFDLIKEALKRYEPRGG
jgi:hypothetical protein